MPHHERREVAGEIVDVFVHRFTIETGTGRVLADLGPKGAEAFPLAPGQRVVACGEMKPSELKVDRISREGEPAVVIAHKKPHEHDPHHHDPHHHGPHQHEPADPKLALSAVAAVGLLPLGEPRRKPKHFEVLARKGRQFVECHVELDGHIRKEKPVPHDDHKWAHELHTAA